VRRRHITPHRALRHVVFRREALLYGAVLAILFDAALIWQGSRALHVHARVVEALLGFSGVSWEDGTELVLLPGLSVGLLSTSYADYQNYPLYPWLFVAGSLAFAIVASPRSPLPMRPLVWAAPFSLGVTLFYLKAVSPGVPYNPEDFSRIWYHGETYLWLLLPWIAAVALLALDAPLRIKAGWLGLLFLYSFLWSAVRLATALATFHYLGSLWMPFFYFTFGFLADFLYIVAFYSMAIDQSSRALAQQRQTWQ